MKQLTIIGGGLAGTEAAWQAAEHGLSVRLFEMRPARGTGAHLGGDLAELVCSNSLGSHLPDRAGGVLKHEMVQLDSLPITSTLTFSTGAPRSSRTSLPPRRSRRL